MRSCLLAWIVVVAAAQVGADEAAEFRVARVTPPDGAANVDLDPLIQVHTSGKFDPRSLGRRAVALIGPQGEPVPVALTADLGGVITVSVEKPLTPDTAYRIEVGQSLKAINGAGIRPLTSSFRTTATPPEKVVPRHFQFAKTRLDLRDGVCGLALAPGALVACTWDGKLIRYVLDDEGLPAAPPEVVLDRPQRRFLSLVCEASSDEGRTVLWMSHDSLARQSLGPNDYSGTISRIALAGESVEVQDFVCGLPTGDHPATGLVFGPDGKLYVSQGALTMLGDKPGLKETVLSAAVLQIDLSSQALQEGRRPLNVRTDREPGYDPAQGPVRVYATGIREAYDLCWHSNGQLYAGVNMNDTAEKTPAARGVPAINARPPEMLIRIVEGKYYGHPNPARGEWVLLGGNPTEHRDPWEVPEYPVGTMPDPRFDHRLLLRNLEDDKGPSANGCVEWTGGGPLQGRLLICFYTATRGIHTYRFADDGTRVVDHQPLLDASGQVLRFGAPLDVVFDARGWLYVADFSAPERGDSGTHGGVWKVAPLNALPP